MKTGKFIQRSQTNFKQKTPPVSRVFVSSCCDCRVLISFYLFLLFWVQSDRWY